MMSLFTTSSAPSDPSRVVSTPSDAARADPIRDAIRDGAEKTGTDFDYLLATAQRESALDPKAKAAGSSATGLFQFIEQTWLGLVKSEGPKLGLSEQAATIATRQDGGYAVADPTTRQAILGLRDDPKLASVLAGTLTQKNRDILTAELGREPSRGDLYVAHVMGARGAVDLIRSAQTTPARAAATDFPEAAGANRAIFFDRSGRARGAGEVYAKLADGAGVPAPPPAAGPAAPTVVRTAAASPVQEAEKPLAFAGGDRPGFHGLFQTDSAHGPVSDAVARIWRGGAKPEAGPAQRYFPRAEGAALVQPEPTAVDSKEGVASLAPAGKPSSAVAALSDAAVAAANDSTGTAPDSVPLPPRRPTDLDGRGRAASSRSRTPLDLGSFMQRSGV
jgi:hypothetical protein